jgi:phosphodiesterase/alkaline phosphatase D-like protein
MNKSTPKKEGNPMTKPEHTPKQPRTTGRFVLLCNLLGVAGIRASKIRLLLSLAGIATFFAFTGTALAEVPEKPVTEPATGETATTAILHGTLNPAVKSEGGSYQFDYAPAETGGCGGNVAPLSPALALGDLGEKVQETVTGLEPNREYLFCVEAFSLLAEPAAEQGTPVSFKTLQAKPTIVVGSENASGASAKGATLEALLDANAEATSYEFEYATAGKTGAGEELKGTIVKVAGASNLEGYGDQTASVATQVLAAGKSYFYRVLATNGTGTSVGPVQEFASLAVPKTEPVGPIGASTATFNGKLTPINASAAVEAQYSFEYNVGAECTGGKVSGPTGAGKTGSGAVSEAVTELEPDATYSVCLVSSNPFGSEADVTPVTFKTLAAPPSIESESSSALTPEGATLEAVINPNNQASTCQFEYGAEASLATHKTVACPAALGSGGSGVATSVTLTGLGLNTPYYFRVSAENAAHEKITDPTIETFTTENTVAPEIVPGSEEAPLKDLTLTTAVLQAEINPEGAASEYHFEYDTRPYNEGEAAHGTGTAVVKIPGGREPVSVSQKIEGLKANTEYYWRLTATNAAGTTTSPSHTLNDLTGGENLPDNRAYEMVTPPVKNGGLIDDTFSDLGAVVSEDGSRVIAQDIQCFGGVESCNAGGAAGAPQGEPFQFTRTDEAEPCKPSAPPCWVTTALAPPTARFSENIPFLYNATLGTTLFTMPPQPTEPNYWYARSADGAFLPIGPATPPPGRTNTEPFKIHSHRATADLSNIVWENSPIYSTREDAFWPFDETTGNHSLYEYAGTGNTEPLLVGVNGGYEDGKNHNLISTCETLLGGAGIGDETNPRWNALSADGRTVYFTAMGHDEPDCESAAPHVTEIYARVDGETAEAHTVKISRGITHAVFVGASEDGAKAFFIEGQSLYESACTSACEREGETRELIEVSAGSSAPEVQGVVATSADGSHVYFVARGVLTTSPSADAQGHGPHGEPVGSGAVAQPGEDNLYVFDTETRQIAFIASLPGSDRENWENGIRIANVTPDGGYLVFQSHGNLTRDDTRDGEYTQIFRYDAAGEQLARLSIGENGFDDNGNAGVGEATFADGNLGGIQLGSARGDPTMSNDGSYVFFQSPIALTPHALDDVVIGTEEERTIYAENVYEYHEGHVYLISDGRDTGVTRNPCDERFQAPARSSEYFGSAVCLLGADASGHNVFFMTSDQLVSSDTDTQADIYDARICEPEQGNPCVAPEPAALPPCGGEACHGIPPERSPGSSGPTETFNGALNPASVLTTAVKPKSLTRAQKLTNALKQCKKDKKKSKRLACEKTARKNYGPVKKAKKSARKSSTNGRTGR